jgi:hypothetical protein
VKKIIISLGIILSLLILLFPSGQILAATTAVVTVTNSTQYIAISIDHNTWTVNGLVGDGLIYPNTTYYANPLGDTLLPTLGGATDAQCYFTISNTSNMAIDVTVSMLDFAGGSDNPTNSNTGSAGASTYGAYSYFSGQASGSWGVVKSSGNTNGNGTLNLSDATKKCGVILSEQTNAWTGSLAATSTITYTATAH